MSYGRMMSRDRVGEGSFSKDPQYSKQKKYLENGRVQLFRQKFFKTGLVVDDFLETCQTLYGMISDQVAHKIGPFVDLPKCNDIEAIKEVLAIAGMVDDESKVLALQVFLRPLPKLTTTYFNNN
jgi:hypothetical protein